MIIAIDPGNIRSAYCIIDDSLKPIEFNKLDNGAMLGFVAGYHEGIDTVVIEKVASYGMPVGAEVFETCIWIGRFTEAARRTYNVEYVFRIDEKLDICHDSRAKDANIRRALIDRFATHDFKNGKGTKDRPDWFYGFVADVWAAYAVGVTYMDKRRGKQNNAND